jgi:DNA-binding NarL/FixJ family response regulator
MVQSLMLGESRDVEIGSRPRATAHAGQGVEWGSFWRRIAAGKLRVVESTCSETRCNLVLEEVLDADATPLSAADVRILERILMGESQKAIALDWHSATSTIATKAIRCFRAIGLECSSSTVPTALVMLVHVSLGRVPALKGEVTFTPEGRILVSIRRPDNDLEGLFSAAERQVIAFLIEGITQREMAVRRNTSPRTIANQVGSAYVKLRVSGRIAMIGLLLEKAARLREIPLYRRPSGTIKRPRLPRLGTPLPALGESVRQAR